ncbi:hypothetical protein FRC17_010857, partial [Serendipita sp. 399]
MSQSNNMSRIVREMSPPPADAEHRGPVKASIKIFERNVDHPLEKATTSPGRSSHLSEPHTPVSPPRRDVLSPRQSKVASPSSSRPTPLQRGDEIRQRACHSDGHIPQSPSQRARRSDLSDLFQELEKSIGDDPVESPCTTPGKSREIYTVDVPTPANLADDKATHESRVSEARIPLVLSSLRKEGPPLPVVPPGNGKSPWKSIDEPNSALDRENESNPDATPKVHAGFPLSGGDIALANGQGHSYGSPLVIQTNEEDISTRLLRKRSLEDAGEDNEKAISVKINKRVRLNSLGEASPIDLSGIIAFDFDTRGEKPYSIGDPYSDWEADVFKSRNIVDDLLSEKLSQGNDSTTNVTSVLSSWLDGEERNPLDDTVAAPLTADDLYTVACEKLRVYKGHVEAGHDPKVREIARNKMAEAWRRWGARSTHFIGMGEVRAYAEALDADGRQAIADALGVQSDEVPQWVEGARPSREKKKILAHPSDMASVLPVILPPPPQPRVSARRTVPAPPLPVGAPSSSHPILAPIINPNPTPVQVQDSVSGRSRSQRRRAAPVSTRPPSRRRTAQNSAPGRAATATSASAGPVSTPLLAPVLGHPTSASTPAATSAPAPAPVAASLPATAPVVAPTLAPTPAPALAPAPAPLPPIAFN